MGLLHERFRMKYQIMATVLLMLFLLPLISNASYGAIFTMQYPKNWSLQEGEYGYTVTSPIVNLVSDMR